MKRMKMVTQKFRSSINLMMIFSIYVLATFSIAFGQTIIDTSATGTWMGILKAGGANLRLVFNLTVSDSGILSGSVGSPDKGLKGIPLSRVYITGDSLRITIAAANAGYEGIFSAKKTSIEGIWKEGGISFPMTLTRTTDTIETLGLHDYAKDSIVSLSLQKKSRHFEFYSTDKDYKVLDDIAKILEKNYSRILSHLHTRFLERIKVNIYPDIKSFHNALYWPDAPDWAVGAAGLNEVKMVSPLNPGSVHTYASLMQAIVHELVHATVLRVRGEQGLAGLPKWLNEGYAFYEANQMNDDMRRAVQSHSLENTPPTWNQLGTADAVEFGNIGGYPLSTTIIEFLVTTYGFEKLVKLIQTPENIEDLYGISRMDLEKQWIHYLKTM